MSDASVRVPSGAAARPPAVVSHLVARRRRQRGRWPAAALLGLFLGYLALGKGFAYTGTPPVFIGEVSLVVLLLIALRANLALPSGSSPRAALLLVVGGALHAAIDLLYGGADVIETLRGFAIVYYALFAVLVYGALSAAEAASSMETVVGRLHRVIDRALIVVVPVLVLLAVRMVGVPLASPTWPGSGVPMLVTKAPDIGMGLAFCLPLVWSRLSTARRTGVRLVSTHALVVIWVMGAVVVAARSRAAVLALAIGLVVTFGVHARSLAKVVYALALTWVLLRITDFRMRVAVRELSADGLVDAVVGVALPGAASDPNFAATSRWRSEWWSAIARDAWNEHWWLRGPGWGTNLATKYRIDDRFAATQEFVALRLPHNFLVGLVGRVGFVLTALFMAVPVLALLATRPGRLRPEVAAHPLRRAVQVGVLAQIAVGLTDVYLESPQGAILFWMQLGVLWWMGAQRRAATAAS